jgi:regulation of enolase protein 1 (concanavalin A-like superfamily)
MRKREKGQGLVEFALVMPVLLLIILAIIETALIFQGYLTVQHAAREAARWAVTYKPEKHRDLDGNVCCPNETDEEYWARRAELIKEKAVEAAVGLRIDEARLGLTPATFEMYANEPNFYGVEIWGYPSFNPPPGGWTEPQLLDNPGLQGLPIRVRVTHNVELLDPLYRAIVPRVRVVAQTEMINEGTQAGFGNVAPPSLPPGPALPTTDWEPLVSDTPDSGGGGVNTPTPDPLGSPVPTLTRTPGPSATPTETPTATPSGPFITASQYQVIPTELILVNLHQHAQGSYALRWMDENDNLVTVISPTVVVDDSETRLNIEFTVPADNRGLYYLETRQGGSPIGRSSMIEVVPPPPDLTVRSINVPEEILPNEEITVTVEIENLSTGIATGYFDVDLYVDPESPPLTDRPGTSKQWLEGLGAYETRVVTHVVTLYGGGAHELWAKVDTSDWIPDELDEDNNLLGPLGVVAGSSECSEMSDRFDGPDLDAKWTSTMIGDASVHNMTIDEDEGTLSIEANGTNLWNRPDQGSTLLYQTVTGDFVATLQVVQGLEGSGQQWAKIGLMARASAAADSRWVMAMKTNNGLQFGFRSGSGGERFASDVAAGAPVWVRLVRSGDTFSAFYSSDGASWSRTSGDDEDGGVTVDMPDTILIGIAAASYSTTPGTGIVDDFEVCPMGPGEEICQGYSDDFEDGSTVVWSDADIGDTVPGSSSRSGGTMTVLGNGGSLWGSDNFHYTYQQVNGNFVATLQINDNPSRNQWSKAGLMVRGSTNQNSAQVMAMKTRDHGVQFGYRDFDGGDNERFGVDTEDGSLPVWVRIARNGNAFAAFYSTDGDNWSYGGSATASLPEDVLIGMAVASYAPGELDSGNFEDFLFCAGEAGAIEPPILPPEERPPGLKECVQVIESGDFEAVDSMDAWTYSFPDASKTSTARHSGNFALQFRASVGPPPLYEALDPWAYQTVGVPSDVLAGNTTGTLSFWQLVRPDPPGGVADPDDQFYLSVRDADGTALAGGIPLAQGDTETPVFQQQVISIETHLPGNGFADLAGQDLQMYFYGVHDNDDDGTYFYVDDIVLNICTTEPIPEDEPGTASFGGLVEVLLAGVPTKMPGLKVLAYAPGGQLYRTTTIHDSTYHFYNIPPGTYTVQAYVTVGGYEYWSSTEITLVADERNYGLDLLLQ